MKAKRVLLAIFLLGVLLRFYRLDQIPPGLNRDEAAIGYNAYSILKTGRDEHGAFLPLSLKSFGDWKLPVYVYATIPAISIFGLSELAVRLPSALSGSLTVLLVFFICRELFKDDIEKGEKTGLWASLLLALSPWHIHFSRAAYEANLAVFFLALAILFLLRGLNKGKLHPLFSLFFGLTLLTYHAFHVFAPLLFLSILATSKDVILNKWRSNIISFAIFSIFLLLTVFMTITKADNTKIQGTSYIFDKSLNYVAIDMARNEHSNNFIDKLFHNRITFSLQTFIGNYFNSFSPDFLFIKGGSHPTHNIPGIGNMLFLEYVFFLFGLYFVFKTKIEHLDLVIALLILSPVAASLTKDAPHSARSVMMLPVLQIIAGLGIYEFLRFFKRRERFAIRGLIILIAINFVFFVDLYFVHFPIARAQTWYSGYKEMAKVVNSFQDKYQEVVIDGAETSPYIYLLFYQKYDPTKFQKNVKYYPEKSDGITDIQSFDKYEFRSIDWQKDISDENILSVGNAYQVPVIQLEERPKGRLLKTINLHDGSPIFQIVGIKK